MFNWKFLKKVKVKGVSMVEYAVLLAFVAVVAGVFMDDGGLEKGILGSVNKILAVLDGETSSELKKKEAAEFSLTQGYWLISSAGDGKHQIKRDTNPMGRSSDFFDLDESGTYTVQFDKDLLLDGLMALGNDKDTATSIANNLLSDAKSTVGLYVVNGTGHTNTEENVILADLTGGNGFKMTNVDGTTGSVFATGGSFANSGNIMLSNLNATNTSGTNGVTFTTKQATSICINTNNTSDAMAVALKNSIIITKK